MTATITTVSSEAATGKGQPASGTNSARRLLAVAAAAAAGAAGAAIWAIATAAGMSLHQPASGTAAAAKLSIALVVAVPAIAALAGWAVSRLIARRAARPARAWFTVTAIVLLVSLAGPLSGHGVSTANRLVLVAMHLTVGAIIAAGMRPATRREPARIR